MVFPVTYSHDTRLSLPTTRPVAAAAARAAIAAVAPS